MTTQKEECPVPVAFTLDFETGGLKCQTSACTQIAIHATRLDTFERTGSYMRYIYPYDQKEIKGITAKRKTLKSKYEAEEAKPMEYEEKALTYSAITMSMLYSMGEDIKNVSAEVIDFIKSNTPPKTHKNMKPFFIGQNVGFDTGFLQQMMAYAGLTDELSKLVRGYTDFYGNFQPLTLDTIVLGQLAMCHLPNINTYKLEIMCERLGVELDDAHDADADVSATTNIVGVLTQRMRSTGGVMAEGPLAISKTEKSRKHFKI
jgi:DNA polymerase III epsilon subunit-like protein